MIASQCDENFWWTLLLQQHFFSHTAVLLVCKRKGLGGQTRSLC